MQESVTSIGDYAFYDCASLATIDSLAGVTSIGNEVFAVCPNLILRVPCNSYAATYAQDNDIPFEYID